MHAASHTPQPEYMDCAYATRGMGYKYNAVITDLNLKSWQVLVAQLIHLVGHWQIYRWNY